MVALELPTPPLVAKLLAVVMRSCCPLPKVAVVAPSAQPPVAIIVLHFVIVLAYLVSVAFHQEVVVAWEFATAVEAAGAAVAALL